MSDSFDLLAGPALDFGAHTVESGGVRAFELGDLELRFERRAHDWRVVEDPETASSYAYASVPEGLHIAPRMADRPVQWRPPEALNLAPGARVTLYLQTPVWVQLSLGELAAVVFDRPTRVLRDTWCGTPTQGTAAYVVHSPPVFVPGDVEPDAHLITTELTLHNAAEEVFVIDGFVLPAPVLGLHRREDGSLCTPAIRGTRDDAGERMEVEVGTPPVGARLLAEAREPLSRSFLETLFD